MKRECSCTTICTQCGRGHNTLLHQDRSPANNETIHKYANREEPSIEQELQVSISASSMNVAEGHTGVGDGECTMALIPVKKKKGSMVAVLTYAFLDPRSSVTFCSEGLMQQLGAEGRKMKIKLLTMSQPYDTYTHVLNDLEVTDLKEENVVSLPRVYSTNQMPVGAEHIPTEEDLSQWSHLCDIQIPKIKAPTELLIGNNVPGACTPIEIRSGP
jgi:hypothetical protein